MSSDQFGKPPTDAAGRGLAEVLASIRDLVSAETVARLNDDAHSGTDGEVLILTPEMRVRFDDEPVRSGEILTEGLDAPATTHGGGAPILDEEALRSRGQFHRS